jgi:hypothetical protein
MYKGIRNNDGFRGKCFKLSIVENALLDALKPLKILPLYYPKP